MIDWPLAFSMLSNARKVVGELREVDKQLSEADLKLKIAELRTNLADIQTTLTDAKADATEKDKEIERLKKLQQRVADETIEFYGYKYRTRKDGKSGGAGRPFCDVCFQKHGLLIETAGVHGKPISTLQCPNCKAQYSGLHTYTD
jgi:hypothetical protein